MARLSTERLAQAGILILLLALLRTVGEYYRLRTQLGASLGFEAFAPFITGLLLGLAGLVVGVVLHFGGRFRAVVAVVAATLGVLLVYKLRVIGI